jgi:hypothetical protein
VARGDAYEGDSTGEAVRFHEPTEHYGRGQRWQSDPGGGAFSGKVS